MSAKAVEVGTSGHPVEQSTCKSGLPGFQILIFPTSRKVIRYPMRISSCRATIGSHTVRGGSSSVPAVEVRASVSPTAKRMVVGADSFHSKALRAVRRQLVAPPSMRPFPPFPNSSKGASVPMDFMALRSSWRKEDAASLSAWVADGPRAGGSIGVVAVGGKDSAP